MTKNQSEIHGRLLIVGSARSGTTLLQAMLAMNSQVYSFPESHFFCRVIRDGRRKRLFGMANVSAGKLALRDLIELVRRKDTGRPGPRWDPRIKSYAKAFTSVIDSAAMANGKPFWVEKTPHHIDHLEDISKFVDGARFIHILRDGRDVVASQFAAQQQDADYWRPWSVERMAKSWGSDVSISLDYVGHPDHFFVSYSDLTADPESVLRSVCEFAGLDFEIDMLNHWEAVDYILGGRKSEPWMKQVYGPVVDTHLVKFNALFSSEQQNAVISNLRFGGDIHAAFMAKSTN